MKKLYILRHAKAEHNSKIDDHERPLSPQGLEACAVVANYMQAHKVRPDIILCSPSSRTRGTIEAISSYYPLTDNIHFLPSLYLATAGEIFKALAVAKDASSVLISGHNPGLHHFALLLAGEKGAEGVLASLKEGLPTAGLISFECQVDNWEQLEPGLGRLVGFFRRK